MRIRRSFVPVVAIAAVLALAGCTPDPTIVPPAETPVAEETPTPEPTVAPVVTVAAIVIGPDGIELQDAGGSLIQSLAFTMNGADFITNLTNQLGSDPTTTPNTGGLEFGPSTTYAWGGFEVWVADGGTPGTQQPPVLIVATSAALPTGETVTTTQGYAVGDDCFAIAEIEGASLAWSSVTDCDIATEFGVDYGVPEVDGYPNANSVELFGDAFVNRILSPANLGIGRV